MFFNMFFAEKCTDSSMFGFISSLVADAEPLGRRPRRQPWLKARRGQRPTFRSPPEAAALTKSPMRQPWLKAVGAKGKCPFARNSYRHLSPFNSIYLLYLHKFNLRKLNTVRCMKRMKPMAKVHK